MSTLDNNNLTMDQQRRVLIFELLKEQCKKNPSCSNNAHIVERIRTADLQPRLTPDDVGRAVSLFEDQRLIDEIEEIYWDHFWLVRDEDELWTSVLH